MSQIPSNELKYPAEVITKVIMPGDEDSFAECRDYLLPFVEEEAGTPRNWRCKASGKGRFLSLTFTVDVASRDILERLYQRLHSLERVKMVL